jgi:hypothetical protein
MDLTDGGFGTGVTTIEWNVTVRMYNAKYGTNIPTGLTRLTQSYPDNDSEIHFLSYYVHIVEGELVSPPGEKDKMFSSATVRALATKVVGQALEQHRENSVLQIRAFMELIGQEFDEAAWREEFARSNGKEQEEWLVEESLKVYYSEESREARRKDVEREGEEAVESLMWCLRAREERERRNRREID